MKHLKLLLTITLLSTVTFASENPVDYFLPQEKNFLSDNLQRYVGSHDSEAKVLTDSYVFSEPSGFKLERRLNPLETVQAAFDFGYKYCAKVDFKVEKNNQLYHDSVYLFISPSPREDVTYQKEYKEVGKTIQMTEGCWGLMSETDPKLNLKPVQ